MPRRVNGRGLPLLRGSRCLTAWVLVGLQHGRGALHAVDDAQQSAREPQQLAEAVEAKVDEVVRQADHLQREGRTESEPKTAMGGTSKGAWSRGGGARSAQACSAGIIDSQLV